MLITVRLKKNLKKKLINLYFLKNVHMTTKYGIHHVIIEMPIVVLFFAIIFRCYFFINMEIFFIIKPLKI